MNLDASAIALRAADLTRRASACRLCPHECGVDRLQGEVGRCGIGGLPRVANVGPHFGEEAVLVGRCGSGTLFFSGCNLACVYCQNWEISHRHDGTDLSTEELARLFLRVQGLGCHNLNLVTPTHQAHAIVSALAGAVAHGFDLPIVWNCGGFESVESLRLLEGIVDIYMPDMKYGSNEVAERFSGAPNYVEVSRGALREMHRQVGDLATGEDGIARRGLLVRHLVLPDGLAGTDVVVRFLANEISPDTYVNVMGQYRPCYDAGRAPSLSRAVRREEIAAARREARKAGLHRFAAE